MRSPLFPLLFSIFYTEVELDVYACYYVRPRSVKPGPWRKLGLPIIYAEASFYEGHGETPVVPPNTRGSVSLSLGSVSPSCPTLIYHTLGCLNNTLRRVECVALVGGGAGTCSSCGCELGWRLERAGHRLTGGHPFDASAGGYQDQALEPFFNLNLRNGKLLRKLFEVSIPDRGNMTYVQVIRVRTILATA